jgi:hypothetical protein
MSEDMLPPNSTWILQAYLDPDPPAVLCKVRQQLLPRPGYFLGRAVSLVSTRSMPLVQLARSSARRMSSSEEEKVRRTYQELFKFPEQ